MQFDDAKECREYFAKRFTQLTERTIKQSEALTDEVLTGLKKAEKDIKDKLAVFYGKFAMLEGISKETAERLLTSDEIDDFKRDLDSYMEWVDAYGADPELDKALEEASLSYRISRLQALELEINVLVEQGFYGMDDIMTRRLEEVYTETYNQTAFEIFKGFNVGQSFSRIDTNRLKKILEYPWIDDGLNYLDRIQKNKEKLKEELPKALSQALAKGMSYTEASEKLGKLLNIPAKNAAQALVTESAYFCTVAQNDMFNELGVDEYEIIATLDNVTSAICKSMDGKVFKVKEMKTGVNAPPFHANCRTVTTPYFDDSDLEGYEDIGRAARGKDGKTYYVPSDMTYKEWAKQNDLKPISKQSNLISDNQSTKKTKVTPNLSQSSEQLSFDILHKVSDLKTYKILPGFDFYDFEKTQATKINAGHKGNPKIAEPNDIIDRVKEGKVFQRSYYDEKGRKNIEYDLTNHGNSGKHPWVPHKHIYHYDDKDEILWKETIDRELTEEEKKEIEDIYEFNDSE